MSNQFYIYKKEVDWSVLNEGFTVPVKYQKNLQKQLKRLLIRGESKTIDIFILNKSFQAKLINQPFDSNKYPNHTDLLQVRYTPNSELSNYLKGIFHHSYLYIKNKRDLLSENKKTYIKIPDIEKEYIGIYATQINESLYFDCVTITDIKKTKVLLEDLKIDEIKYETDMNYNKYDKSAGIVLKERTVKIRKLDKAISEELKLLYLYKCQICNVNFFSKYNENIVEAHHIEHFVKTMNNNSNNIMILCPNHHRLVHKTKPSYDKAKIEFMYPNGFIEKIFTNKHL